MKKSRKKSPKNRPTNLRSLMFVASSVWVALILVILVFRPGGTAQVDRRSVPADPSLALRGLIQQADELASVGEYGAAAVKYWAAVEHEPDEASLRFALGTALSHVGRQEETVEQFRWVVTRGDPRTPEVQVARRWLVGAGVLAEPVTFASSTGPEEDPGVSDRGSTPPGKLKGRTEWRGVDLKGGPRRVRIVLRGEDESNKESTLDTSVKLGEPYEFGKVPPGNYRLTARVSEAEFWKQRVTVEAGQETVLDLTTANRTQEGE